MSTPNQTLKFRNSLLKPKYRIISNEGLDEYRADAVLSTKGVTLARNYFSAYWFDYKPSVLIAEMILRFT